MPNFTELSEVNIGNVITFRVVNHEIVDIDEKGGKVYNGILDTPLFKGKLMRIITFQNGELNKINFSSKHESKKVILQASANEILERFAFNTVTDDEEMGGLAKKKTPLQKAPNWIDDTVGERLYKCLTHLRIYDFMTAEQFDIVHKKVSDWGDYHLNRAD